MWHHPPSGSAIAWTLPSRVFENARLADTTARIIRSRASMSAPSLTAATSERPTPRIASRQSACVMGYAFLQTNDSIACTSVSIPVIAVTNGGQVRVISGSSRAKSAVALGLMMTSFLCWAGSAMTLLMVISAPVPAVVGMATTGAAAFGTLSMPM